MECISGGGSGYASKCSNFKGSAPRNAVHQRISRTSVGHPSRQVLSIHVTTLSYLKVNATACSLMAI